MFTALRHLAAARMSMSKRFSCCIISCARSDSVVVPVLSILHRSRLPYRMLSRFALSFRFSARPHCRCADGQESISEQDRETLTHFCRAALAHQQ
jgi:hypothetical protein